ncbi:MAG TPA: oxygenase MpaB family protein [Bryobacteraceae bacterium]|nr:oxygenase MpaB family protein [Bryobacteraceae bacterium]
MVTLSGLSAVLLQLTHPAIASAGAHGSRMQGDLTGRVRRTFASMYEIIFGDWETAAAAILRIRRIHERVRNDSPQHTYRATDPSLLFWVLATLIDSSIRIYELVARPLSQRDREDYYADMKLFGAAMGIPPDFMPQSWDDFQRYFEAMINGSELVVSSAGRKIAGFLMGSRIARVTWSAAVVTGMLPARWREAYELPWGPKEQRRYAIAIRVLRIARSLGPAWLFFCPAYHQALQGLIAAPRESRALPTRMFIRFSILLRLPWALCPER